MIIIAREDNKQVKRKGFIVVTRCVCVHSNGAMKTKKNQGQTIYMFVFETIEKKNSFSWPNEFNEKKKFIQKKNGHTHTRYLYHHRDSIINKHFRKQERPE